MADEITPHGDDATEPVEKPDVQDQSKETDWKAEARKWESRAKENLTRASANEEAAQRLKELEDAQKSEAEKQAERIAEIERENAELKTATLRAQVAADKGVPANLLNGSTREELEQAADVLIEFRGQQAKPSAAPLVDNKNKTTVEPDFDAAIEEARQSRNFALVATLRQQKAAQTKG